MDSLEEILRKLQKEVENLKERINELEDTEILLEIKFRKYGTSHDGYCSDYDEAYEIAPEEYTETFEVDKEYVRKHIDGDGDLKWYELSTYSSTRKQCSGSGYCRTEVHHEAISGKLIEVKDLKAVFLSRDE